MLNNPTDSRLWDLEQGILLEIKDEERDKWFLNVQIVLCGQGEVRLNPGSLKCIGCPTGEFSVYGPKVSEDTKNWYQPIYCKSCWLPKMPGKFQDTTGNTECKTCPRNTVTTPSNCHHREHCYCRGGYFSQFYDRKTNKRP